MADAAQTSEILEEWRHLLARPGGAGEVARDVLARSWPACPRCRRLGEQLWDRETGALSTGCAICESTLRVLAPELRDYLAAHCPFWGWEREAWLARLTEALGLQAPLRGEGWLRVEGVGRVLRLRAGEMSEVELTLDRREPSERRPPELVLQWWPGRRLLPTPDAPGAEVVARYTDWLAELDAASWGLLAADAAACGAAWFRPCVAATPTA